MIASEKINAEQFHDLQNKLDAYDNGLNNLVTSDVWQFNFESDVYRVDFSYLNNTKTHQKGYLHTNRLTAKDLAKILVLEVCAKQLSITTFKSDVDTLFMLVMFIAKNELEALTKLELQQFFEHYLMHRFDSGKEIERLSPRSYHTARSGLIKFNEINEALGYFDFEKLFHEQLNPNRINNLLKDAIQALSAGELTFGEWKKGGTFNHLTLDYGRYYLEYCSRFFKDNYEKSLGISAVKMNMEEHILSIGLSVHKNTKQAFYGLLSGEDISNSSKYKKFNKDKIDQLQKNIQEQYNQVMSLALHKKHLLSNEGVVNIASSLKIERDLSREDKQYQYLTEIERLRNILLLHLDNEQELVVKLLSESNKPISYEKFIVAIEGEKLAETKEHQLPSPDFYQCIGRIDRKNSQPPALTFLNKVQSAGVVSAVALCGWRGSEFGFPLSAISKKINDDILDQYANPVRYIVDWHVFKTAGEAKTEREIIASTYELAVSLSNLTQAEKDSPALYPVHSHAKSSTSKSASYSAVRKAVAINWENYVNENEEFKILEESKELKKLSSKFTRGQVLTYEQQNRLEELNKKSKTEVFIRIISDPNLIEAKRRAEDEYERIMFVTSYTGESYQAGWLLQYHNYLCGTESTLSDKLIKLLNANLSNDTQRQIQEVSPEACKDIIYIRQVTNEVIEDCLYPTPHAFRHMWAEAVYRRFDGDVGWMIRSNFKHVSKAMWLSYIRDKDNRRMHDTIKVRIASSIMKNWLRKSGKETAGKFHEFLRKLTGRTSIQSLEKLNGVIDKIAREDILSVKANPWGFCIAKHSTMTMTKCWDGYEINPQSAEPTLCLGCINNLTMSSNIDYIVLYSWQHIDLLESEFITSIPAPLILQSLEYIKLAHKRVTELEPSHNIIPRLQSLITLRS
jgi:hypothetical protein